MRKVKTVEQGNQKAVILFDREWNEYRTQYFVDGEYLGEACDNHTDDKDGAVISFRMTDSEDSDVSKLVTLETIAKGLRAILDNAESCCEEIHSSVQQAAQEKDACYLDAWGFDAIAQIGAFGEIVYG